MEKTVETDSVSNEQILAEQSPPGSECGDTQFGKSACEIIAACLGRRTDAAMTFAHIANPRYIRRAE